MPLKDIVKDISLIPTKQVTYEPEQESELRESYKLDFGMSELIGAGMERDSLAVQGYDAVNDMMDSNGFDYDDKFDDNQKEAYWDEHLKDTIHPKMKDSMLSDARSMKHMESMYDDYFQSSAKLRFLEEQSFFTQLAIGAGAELTNAPVYIGATYLLPATMTALGTGAMSRFLASGTAGAMLEGAKEVIGRQDKDVMDYAGAVLFDGAMGAMFGKKTVPFEEIANNMVLKEHGLTKSIVEEVSKATSKEAKNAIIQKAYLKHSGAKADNTLLDSLDANIEYASQNFIQKAWMASRQDMAYITGQSKSDTFSQLSNRMFADPTLQNLRPDEIDMATSRDMLEETMRGERQQIFNPLMKEFSQQAYKSDGTLGIKVDVSTEKTFSKILGDIQLDRNINGTSKKEAVLSAMNKHGLDTTNDKLVDVLDRGADGMSNIATRYHDMLGEAGHKDFRVNDDGSTIIPKDETYARFAYDKNVFSDLINKGMESKDFINFFKNAINSPKVRTTPLDGDLLDGIASRFYYAISESKLDSSGTFSEVMKDIAQSTKLGAEAKDMIESILTPVYKGADETVGTSARTRTNIDYTHKQSFMLNGKEMELSFADLLSKDYIGNMDNYARKMAGTTSLQKFKFKEKATPLSQKGAEKKALETQEVGAVQSKIKARDEARTKLSLMKEELGSLEIVKGFGRTFDEVMNSGNIDEAISSFTKFVSDNKLELDKAISGDKGIANILNEAKRLSDVSNMKGLDRELNKVTLEQADKILKESRISKERSLETLGDFEALRKQITTELDAQVAKGDITTQQANRDLVRFDTIMKDMTGVPTAKDPTSGWNRAYRIAHSYNVGRLLGQTFFTMPAEAMNVAWDVGIKSFIEALPSMKSLLGAYKNGSIKNAQTLEIQEGLGLYDEFLSGARLYEFEHDYSSVVRGKGQSRVDKAVDGLESFGEKFSEFTLMTGGIKPLTAWFQTAHVMGVFKKMSKVANGGKQSTNYKKTIKELGLSEKMAEKVYDNIRKHSADGLMNFKKWDSEVKNVFLGGVKRRTDTLVQMQRLGDKMSWVTSEDYMMKDTIMGKVIFELKQFVMTAYTKQLGRALNRKDMYTVGLMASQMTALTLAYVTKQGLNYAGNEEKMKEALQPHKIVEGTMTMMPQGSVLPMLANFGSEMITGEPIMGQSRHSSIPTNAFSSLPIVDLAGKIIQTMGVPFKIASGGLETSDLKAPASLTGISNNALTRPLFEGLTAKD